MPAIKPTGHKTFDAIAARDYISTGNVLSNIQFSSYIRAFNDIECNGFVKKPGELQAFDMKPWKENRGKLNIPNHVFKVIREEAVSEDVILYCFFHWSRGKRIVHGLALTKGHKQGHKLLHKWYNRFTEKTVNIVNACIEVVAGAK